MVQLQKAMECDHDIFNYTLNILDGLRLQVVGMSIYRKFNSTDCTLYYQTISEIMACNTYMYYMSYLHCVQFLARQLPTTV